MAFPSCCAPARMGRRMSQQPSSRFSWHACAAFVAHHQRGAARRGEGKSCRAARETLCIHPPIHPSSCLSSLCLAPVHRSVSDAPAAHCRPSSQRGRRRRSRQRVVAQAGNAARAAAGLGRGGRVARVVEGTSSAFQPGQSLPPSASDMSVLRSLRQAPRTGLG